MKFLFNDFSKRKAEQNLSVQLISYFELYSLHKHRLILFTLECRFYTLRYQFKM